MNYKIDNAGAKVANDTPDSRWFFPFAKDQYLLSVTNTFKAENYFLKVQDVDGKENGGEFETQLIICKNLNFINEDDFKNIESEIQHIQNMIIKLQNSIDSK